MNQLLQSIANNNNNNNNGNDQSPNFLSLLEAYQREKAMNEMILQSLLGSSLQQQSQQNNNAQQHQQQGNNGMNHGNNYAALLAAANAQNGLNQQQQLLQQALFGLQMNTGLPAVFPQSSNTVSDNALLALLQANNAAMGNNGLNSGANPSTSGRNLQDHNPTPMRDSNAPAPVPLVADSKLMLSPRDNKIDISSALNGNFKAPPNLMPDLKAAAPSGAGFNNSNNNPTNNDLSTLDTAALLTLLTSGKAGGTAPQKMVEAPAPMAPKLSAQAPANPADAALLAMIQQVQQQQKQVQQQQQQQPKMNMSSINIKCTSASSTRSSSPVHKADNRMVNSLIAPIATNNSSATSNASANLAMAVEIASSKSKAQAAMSSKNKNAASSTQSSGLVPTSFIEPQTDDVLFGKGRTKHQGNRHLQKLIENLMPVYEAATKQQKKELADMVVTKILNSGGRFLKLEEDSQRWDEVEREDAHKKVAHAFRNLRRRSK